MGYCVVKLPDGGGPPPLLRSYGGAEEIGALKGMIDSLARRLEEVQARIRDLQGKEG
jgi:hypothetical protein